MKRLLYLVALVSVSLPAVAAYAYDETGIGRHLSGCLDNHFHEGGIQRVPREEIKSLRCIDVVVLDHLEPLDKLFWLALERRQSALISSTQFVSQNINILELIGKGWTKDDLAELASHFPNIDKFLCSSCDIYALNTTNVFTKLGSIHLNLFPRIPSVWKGPTTPEGEFTFDGLPYEQIREVIVSPGVRTSISCKSLGEWSYRVYEFTWANYHLPKPYKDSKACFPEAHKISRNLVRADKLYNEGDLEKAHELYLQSFQINPYDQRVLSSLSLTFYKKGMFCNSAEVAFSGTKLKNGSASTRASIWFNYALALKAIGLVDESYNALQESNRLKPSEAKEKLLAEKVSVNSEENCAISEGWIDEIKKNIEIVAVKRSRG